MCIQAVIFEVMHMGPQLIGGTLRVSFTFPETLLSICAIRVYCHCTAPDACRAYASNELLKEG